MERRLGPHEVLRLVDEMTTACSATGTQYITACLTAEASYLTVRTPYYLSGPHSKIIMNVRQASYRRAKPQLSLQSDQITLNTHIPLIRRCAVQEVHSWKPFAHGRLRRCKRRLDPQRHWCPTSFDTQQQLCWL